MLFRLDELEEEDPEEHDDREDGVNGGEDGLRWTEEDDGGGDGRWGVSGDS